MAKRPVPRTTGLDQLASEKLASSGLGAEDAKLLHIESLTAEQTQNEHPSFKALPSLKLPYIDPRTKKPQRSAPGAPPFVRYRYLKMDTSFESLKDKPQRYTNAPGAGVCAYFPTNLDWGPVLADVRFPIFITEGEFKAACACKAGYATIGLGGADNFRSSKDGHLFIPELDAINWANRHTYIVFDSDFRTKPGVNAATNRLAEQLRLRGAIVHYVPLPDVVQGGKTGLDDFLVHEKGTDPFGDLVRDTSFDLTTSQDLWRMNEEVIIIDDPEMIIMKDNGQKVALDRFKHGLYADRTVPERTLRADGTRSLKPVPAAEAWIKWPCRERAGGITYDPSKRALSIIANEGETVRETRWNVWEGFGVEAKRDDAKAALFVGLLQYLFQGAPPEDLRWFTQWLAYPIQHPGYKLYTAAAIYGVPGCGKSFLGIIMGKVYGVNYSLIHQSDLEGNFSGWAENKQFVLVDEVSSASGEEKRHLADRLKFMITRPVVKINIKFLPEYFIPDHMNYYITSNVVDPIYMEHDDRRFFVHETKAPKMTHEMSDPIDIAHKDGTLASAVRYWLEHVDLTGFKPNVAAPSTTSKELMIDEVRTDLDIYVDLVRTDPDHARYKRMAGGVKAAVPGDLSSGAEMLEYFKLWLDDRGSKALPNITSSTMSKALHRAGTPYFNDSKNVRANNTVTKYFIIRNHEKWKKASAAEGVKHINTVCHDPNNNRWQEADNTWSKDQAFRGK
jgi:hypothetical protein